MKKPLLVSMACHAMLILGILYILGGLAGKPEPPCVYEVSLVHVTSSGEARAVQRAIAAPSSVPSLDEITKDEIPSEDTSDPSPEDTGPESTGTLNYGPGSGKAHDRIFVTVQSPMGSFFAPAQDNGSTLYSTAVRWKNRVIDMLESYAPMHGSHRDTLITATYLLRLGRQGELLQADILESSGDIYFDQSVGTAIRSISHFPPPPPFLVAGSAWLDVRISFSHAAAELTTGDSRSKNLIY